MTYIKLREKAEKLRRAGYSYGMISERLGVGKGTLYHWLARIPYVPNEYVVLRIGEARAKSGEAKSRQKRESISKAKALARQDVAEVTTRDLFFLGIGLYFGEGSKTEGVTRIINADPRIIRLSLLWFKEICGLKTSNFSIRLHLYPDNNEEEAMAYWSECTDLPKEQFSKPCIDRREGKKMGKRGKLPYGTAHITIRSNGNKEHGVFLSRKIHAWIEEVSNKAGLV